MKLIDITGQVFGRLTVLQKSDIPSKWECQCSCGNIKLCDGTNLRSGNTTSCGCLHKEQLKDSNRKLKTISEPWLADMRYYIRKNSYRSNRKTTGKLGSNQFQSKPNPKTHPSLTWGLDLAQYIALITSPCFYCGKSPEQQPKGNRMIVAGVKRNGIDRVDNNRGYEPSNCVSCCMACNREKRAQSQQEFIENTRRRYEHLKKLGLL